jgi:hypothetical protein
VDTDYTVTGVGDPTFSLTLTVALASGEKLFILRKQPLEQTSTYTTEAMPPARVTTDFDKIYMALQQHSETLKRAPLLQKHSLLEDILVEDPSDQKFLYYDLATNKFKWSAITSVGTIPDPVTIARGGTSATTAAAARTNLGVESVVVLIDAKGDLLVGTAADTLVRKAVSTDYKTLQGRAAQSDGLIWDYVDRLIESGAAVLTLGAIADGQLVKRVGTTLVGATPNSKVVTFTRDLTVASGTQAITGTGFPVKAVTFLYTNPYSTNWGGIGIDDGIVGAGWVGADGIGGTITSSTESILFYQGGSTYKGHITTLGADGFTLTWTKTTTPTGTATIHALCVG